MVVVLLFKLDLRFGTSSSVYKVKLFLFSVLCKVGVFVLIYFIISFRDGDMNKEKHCNTFLAFVVITISDITKKTLFHYKFITEICLDNPTNTALKQYPLSINIP